MLKRIGVICAFLLLLGGCATQQSEVKEPDITTPPVVEDVKPTVIVTKEMRHEEGAKVWEWKKENTEDGTVMVFLREEGFEIRFIIALGVKNGPQKRATGMTDSRNSEYDTYFYNKGMNGVALLFRNPYMFLYTNIPTNPMYVFYGDEGYVFKMTNNEWMDMQRVVVNKEGV